MEIKKVLLAGAFALSASAASAATIITDCGVIGDGENANCGSVNLAVFDTQFGFEAVVADDNSSDANGYDGSLTVNTVVNPFFSTGIAGANVRLVLSIGGNAYNGLLPAATLSFGGNTVDMIEAGGSLVVPGGQLVNMFTPSKPTAPLTIAWSGLAGGEQISLRVAAVPLPAGMLLLGTALGGLGLARRKKKAA